MLEMSRESRETGSVARPVFPFTGLDFVSGELMVEEKIKILILIPILCFSSYYYSLGCAAGDNIVASDGDFTEDGQGVVGQKVQLGVPQLRVGNKPELNQM